MKIRQTFKELEALHEGFTVQVITTYSTYDKDEYKALIRMLRKHDQLIDISEVIPDETI